MDENRFDALVKRLATAGHSRRRVLKAVAGGIAGGLLAGLAGRRPGAVDTCLQGNAACRADAQCCSNQCDQTTQRCLSVPVATPVDVASPGATTNSAPVPGATTSCDPGCCPDNRGICWCCYPPDKNCCPGGHYAGCAYQCCSDADCPGIEVCQAGAGCVCPAGKTYCNGLCTDTSRDPTNCGACGSMCPAGELCCNSTCLPCPQGAICAGQGCACPDVFPTNCANACVNLQTNQYNCGTCGHFCPYDGACCSGACTDLRTDNANCGQCGEVCPSGFPTCCGGNCTTVQSDQQNCGGCGLACPADRICVNGACICVGLFDCGGVCVDLYGDPANCGACGHHCRPNQSCVNGKCRGHVPPCRGRCDTGTCACPEGSYCDRDIHRCTPIS